MPYRIVGNTVEHFKNGKWSAKQTCSSPADAKAALRLLQGIEHNPEFAKKVHSRKKVEK